MRFHIAKAAAKTGALLQEMVTKACPNAGNDIHVCYGAGYRGAGKVLNALCSEGNKLQQATRLQEGLGLGGLTIFNAVQAKAHLQQGGAPLFARNTIHAQGKDIKIALEGWQIDPLVSAGTGFFSLHVPSNREFRTWVYRKRHLGTYEKVLRRPQECKRLGRNYLNGFDFSGIEHDEVPDALQDSARKALKALGLDFGAVDILQKPDGGYVVLEVNSAPGVSGEHRKCIKNLAHRITRWIENGCPAQQE